MTEPLTRDKHPGRVTQRHKLAALMKKRKEKIQRNNEQSTAQSIEQSSVQSTEKSSVQPTEQPSAQSNGAYIYGVGILAVLLIGVCVFFAYNPSQASKKQANEKKRINYQNDVICFRKIYNK